MSISFCTAAEVKTFAPEFCDVDIPTIEKFIALAECQMDSVAWGSRLKHGCILLTAHMLTVARVKDGNGAGGAGVGPISEVSVGQVSVSYAGMATTTLKNSVDAALASSVYGVEFGRLVTLAAYGAAVI